MFEIEFDLQSTTILTPGGEKPVEARVRIRIRIDDNFDTRGGGPVRVRIRIDDSDFGVRLLLFVHRVDF